MGVLDPPGGGSLSGNGRPDVDAWSDRAEEVVGRGADVLEVGLATVAAAGPEVTEAEELEVVVALVGALHERVDVPLSCATERASVARAAYAAGAVLGDDPSGFSDPDYLPAAVLAGASVVAGHAWAVGPDAGTEAGTFLAERGRRAEEAGLARERIVLDPGLGAVASLEDWLRLLRTSPALAQLGYPLLASVPQLLAGPTDGGPDDRRGTTVAATALAIVGGCRVLRASDVRTARRVADVLHAILSAE